MMENRSQRFAKMCAAAFLAAALLDGTGRR